MIADRTDPTFCRWEWEGASTKQMVALEILKKKEKTAENPTRGHTYIQHMHTKTDHHTPDKHLITWVSISVCETSRLNRLFKCFPNKSDPTTSETSSFT